MKSIIPALPSGNQWIYLYSHGLEGEGNHLQFQFMMFFGFVREMNLIELKHRMHSAPQPQRFRHTLGVFLYFVTIIRARTVLGLPILNAILMEL